ncbi:MAG: DUF86 domain-containing protein [Clostridiales bacterium]|nr:DUF86 domain-containing protein [Clostridiales bacterium]
MKEHEKVILEKMKLYAEQAIQFKGDMTFEEFSNDLKTISACIFNLSQIGALVSRLDDRFIDANSQIPWRSIKGMRNRIVHDYEGIQLNIIWDVLEDFLPQLIQSISEID